MVQNYLGKCKYFFRDVMGSLKCTDHVGIINQKHGESVSLPEQSWQGLEGGRYQG